jgi:hypothetical protein
LAPATGIKLAALEPCSRAALMIGALVATLAFAYQHHDPA